MHQTFYIDADEEISSVIDRLRKSMAVDNYFVAPKRAIFLQSIVNLKLLKREAEKIKKHVILVSQEEVVMAMALRSGIDVQKSVDGFSESMDVESDEEDDDFESEDEIMERQPINTKSSRLSSVGSSDFYDAGFQPNEVQRQKNGLRNANVMRSGLRHEDNPVSSRVSNIGKHPSKNISNHGSNGVISEIRVSSKNKANLSDRKLHGDKNENFAKLNPSKEKKLEMIFSQKKAEKKDVDNKRIHSKKAKNVLFTFVLVSMILLAGVAGYLFVPSAAVTIRPNVQALKIDADVNVGQVGQVAGNVVAVHVINQEQQLTLRFDATGKSSSSGKKAKGSVVIYNEFDNQSQTLVANTRIQSEDGKVFRLMKNVVVPGVSSIGGEVKPGAISAEVVADQPGADYNIEAGSFKIPGFQGGPKYDKFYAKASVAMTGGTTEGNASAGVSQDDLNSAKKKTEAALQEKISAAILSEMNPDEVALPQAEKITPEKSYANVKAGDGAESFEYTASANVIALVFSQQDVKAVIEKTSQFSQQPAQDEKNIKNLDYVSVQPSFENNTIDLKVHADFDVISKVDIENVKNELLGKNEAEMADLLKKNQGKIAGIDVNFWPTFINRIPQFPQRVKIELGKNQ